MKLNPYKAFLIVIILGILIVSFIIFKKNTSVTYEISLFRDLTIELYEGDDYIEYGFTCFDSKNNNCNNKVVIKNNVDTNVVGIYSVNYQILSANKKVLSEKSRMVIVKENQLKNIEFKLNGGQKISTFLNEKYEELGYTIKDINGIELKHDVNITGGVNVNKVGTYYLDYTITISGKSKTITREINVVDLEVLENFNKAYTNQDISINLITYYDDFNYIELPNATKVYENNITYKVNENGIYLFKMYNKFGFSKLYSVTISNIDKEKPKATCIAKGNKVTVEASDNSGILGYSYAVNNSPTFTSYISNNFYDYSNILYNAQAKVSDNAGNVIEINCSNELVIGPSFVPTVYKDSLNYDCLYPYTCFKQLDYSDAYRAGSLTVGTIRTSGCMPASLTIILSGFNKRDNNNEIYSPKTFVNNYLYAEGKIVGYSNYGRIEKTAQDFNLSIVGNQSYSFRKNTDILKQHLKNGYPAIVLVSDGCYTGNFHYLTILGINEKDEIFVSDPYSRKQVSYKGCIDNTWISFDYFLSSGSPYDFTMIAPKVG